jgi:hypothetical protein
MGRGLVPADGVLTAPPWNKSFHVPSNALLADQYASFIPVRQFFTDEIRQGRFPLWNPHLSSGMPSLAGMQVAALYPIHLLLSPLGPFVSSGIAAYLKLFLAGVFTLLYLRRLGVSAPAGLAGGLVFSLSGFMIVWLGHPHANPAVLLPALFYFIELQFAKPLSWRPWIGMACAYGVMLLGGHPPTAVHITAAASLYFAFRFLEHGREHRPRLALQWLAALVAGAALAAPQLLTYLEYYRESSSPLATAALERWASHLTPAALLSYLLPFFSGAPHLGFEDLSIRLGLGEIDNFAERTGYVGLFTLFLVVVGLARVRNRVAWFHAGLAALALLIVYGVPPFPALMHVLPIANGINHQRLLLIVAFSAAILAAFGLDELLRADLARRPRRLAIGFAAAVVLTLVVLWVVVGTGLSGLDDSSRGFLLRQGWVPAVGIVLALTVTLRGVSTRVVAALSVGWIAIDLLWFAMGYNPAISRELYYPSTNAIRALQSDPSRFRILGHSTVLMPNTAAVYGLDDVRGYDFTTLKRYEELITGSAGDFFFYRAANRVPKSFPVLNAKYVLLPEKLSPMPDGYELVYDGEIAIYRYAPVADRALVVLRHEVEPRADAILDRVRSGTFDPSQMLLLEEPPERPPEVADSSVGASEARILAYAPDRVVIEAHLPQRGFLLLLDNYYPGWRAFAGGRELRILRADYTFRAVALPAGVTQVEFVYRPWSFRLGLLMSSLTVVVLVVLWRR